MTTDTRKKAFEIIDIEYFVNVISKYWMYITLCIAMGLFIAFIYNKLTRPVYIVKSSILISSEDSYNQISAQIMEGLGFMPSEKNFQNEIQLLKSTILIGKAINNLNFYITYYYHHGFQTTELYKNSPFVVIYDQDYPQPVNIRIKLVVLDEQNFKITAKEDNVNIYNFTTHNTIQTIPEFELNQFGVFGEELKSEYCKFKVILNKNFNIEDYKSNKFFFIIFNPKILIKRYQSRVEISPVDLESSVAQLEIKSTTPAKDIDYINSLTLAYLTKDLEKKKFNSVKTVEYIDDQLNIIKDSLKIAEENLQRFRSTNKIMDVSVQSGRVYDQLRELEREKANISVNYKYYQYINNYFEENKEFSDLIAPSAMGIEDPLLNNMIQELLELNAERVSLIENNQEKSPYLKKLNIRIDNLKNTISENIKYILNTTRIAIQDINGRINQLNGEIRKLPETERELFGIERKFNLNDAIYTYLLEKRAEAQIAEASYLPDAEIMEPADIEGDDPISPKKKLNYLVGIILGFIVPLFIIRMKDILNVKLKDNSELDRIVDVPILGKIYRNSKKIELVVTNFPKSHIAESFRMLRINLNYFLPATQNSIIVFTSAIAQEGKSFIANNLAVSLASANNRTILVGFDLRKPKIYERLNIKNEFGLSTFLSEQASFADIVQKSNIQNLDIITSGPIPPNPSELIAGSKTNDLFSFLTEKYKYILIDTPPVGLISDSYLLMDKANLNIFVVRQNFSIKKDVSQIIQELQSKKIKNVCVVINDSILSKTSKYGYDYYEDRPKKSFFKSLI